MTLQFRTEKSLKEKYKTMKRDARRAKAGFRPHFSWPTIQETHHIDGDYEPPSNYEPSRYTAPKEEDTIDLSDVDQSVEAATATENEPIPMSFEQTMAKERHDLEMDILRLDRAAKEIELDAKRLMLAEYRARIDQQAAQHHLKMQILKSRLQSENPLPTVKLENAQDPLVEDSEISDFE